jgi:hypothetical protein
MSVEQCHKAAKMPKCQKHFATFSLFLAASKSHPQGLGRQKDSLAPLAAEAEKP